MTSMMLLGAGGPAWQGQSRQQQWTALTCSPLALCTAVGMLNQGKMAWNGKAVC